MMNGDSDSDSDSDGMWMGDGRYRTLKRQFRLMDADGNGFVTRAEQFEWWQAKGANMADKVIVVGNASQPAHHPTSLLGCCQPISLTV